MKTIITFGTFDVFHVGHLSIINRARELGDQLIVGVSSDIMNISKKGRMPVYSQQERMAIIGCLKAVDGVFLEQSLALKAEYISKYGADVLVMGDDWKGHFDSFSTLCEVVYLPRTPSISTTSIIEVVKSM